LSSNPSPASAIVLYDSKCGLCDRSVRWLIAHDPHSRLLFACLQGSTAKELRHRHPTIPAETETLVLVQGTGLEEQVSLRSRAVLGALALLPWPWKVGSWLRVLPSFLLDPSYRLFASQRHHFAPVAAESCDLPPSQEKRFLP
jgi:predicted DCC family thiol-disulfide oxidoreductase YuxK